MMQTGNQLILEILKNIQNDLAELKQARQEMREGFASIKFPITGLVDVFSHERRILNIEDEITRLKVVSPMTSSISPRVSIKRPIRDSPESPSLSGSFSLEAPPGTGVKSKHVETKSGSMASWIREPQHTGHGPSVPLSYAPGKR